MKTRSAARVVSADIVTNLLHFRTFVAIAEERHFGRAAEKLGVSQAAVSQQLRRLERDLGVALVERTTRRMELTPAGRALLPDARRALTYARRAEQRAHEAAQQSR